MLLSQSGCGGSSGNGNGISAVATDRSVTLAWDTPTTRSDGTSLDNGLSGYKVYYGSSSGDYMNQIDIPDASTTGYTTDDLAKGNYFFVVTVYDVLGDESGYSNEVSVEVP
jgi:hypothetical protein